MYICYMPYSLDDTIKKLNINSFKNNFTKYNEFGLNDILKFYQLENPAIKKQQFNGELPDF